MINSWLNGIDGCPAIAATTRARIAIHSAEENVVSTATTTLRRSTPPGRRSIVSRPAAFGGAQARADRAEDRAAHADGGGDQDVRGPGTR